MKTDGGAEGARQLEELCIRDFSLKERTAFGVGGKAAYACFPENAAELTAVLSAAAREKLPCAVLGCASNVVVSDKGFCGVVAFTSKMNAVSRKGDTVVAECGVKTARLLEFCRLNDLSGAEFLCGIPATVGGMLAMNAGAFGGEIGGIVRSVTALCEGKTVRLSPEECAFGYRTSAFGENLVVLSAEFALKTGFDAALTEKITRARREKQPAGKTFGSTFRNGENYFAGELIERAGLKGFSVGGAQVSEKHANFIVNRGDATARDVRRLIAEIRERVYRQFGVTLTEEVRFLGDFK